MPRAAFLLPFLALYGCVGKETVHDTRLLCPAVTVFDGAYQKAASDELKPQGSKPHLEGIVIDWGKMRAAARSCAAQPGAIVTSPR